MRIALRNGLLAKCHNYQDKYSAELRDGANLK